MWTLIAPHDDEEYNREVAKGGFLICARVISFSRIGGDAKSSLEISSRSKEPSCFPLRLVFHFSCFFRRVSLCLLYLQLHVSRRFCSM